jgi:hypothetical protein
MGGAGEDGRRHMPVERVRAIAVALEQRLEHGLQRFAVAGAAAHASAA